MVGLINDWLEQIEAQQKNATELPKWLQLKRHTASQQLKKLKAPNRKLESWRYTDASRLTKNLDVFDTSDKYGTVNSLQSSEENNLNEVVIVIDEAGYTGMGECPDWLEIKSLVQMDERDWLDCTFNQESVVNLANTALFHTGGVIKINPTDAQVKVKLVYAFDESSQWQYIRNHVFISAGAEVKLTEQHQSGRINVVNAFDLGAGAELQRKQQLLLDMSQQFISYNQFECAARTNIKNMSQHIGGSLQHHNHTVNFNAEGAIYQSGSINKSFYNNNISDLVNVNHYYKNNESNVTHRSIATDQSQIYNNAKALVAVGADQSEIEQDLKNILLSSDAKIFSKPELEVYADEVVAAHGSTIGALDETALFYLQSRGVDIEQAKEIMIASFEQEAWVC